MRTFPQRLLRVAAVAAVLAVLLTVLLWPAQTKPGEQLGLPTVGTMAPDMTPIPTQTQRYELIKLSSVLKLYSYDKENVSEEELKQYEVTDTIDGYKKHWIEMLGSHYGIRLSFCLPLELYGDAEIKISLYASYGEYLVKDKETGERVSIGKIAKIRTGEIVAWRPEGDLQSMKEDLDPGEMYLHAIVYADDCIVGFGIIEMASNYILDRSFYAVTLRRFRTFCYPMVDGAYQDVTEEYVWAQVMECEQIMREECKVWRAEKEQESEGGVSPSE